MLSSLAKTVIINGGLAALYATGYYLWFKKDMPKIGHSLIFAGGVLFWTLGSSYLLSEHTILRCLFVADAYGSFSCLVELRLLFLISVGIGMVVTFVTIEDIHDNPVNLVSIPMWSILLLSLGRTLKVASSKKKDRKSINIFGLVSPRLCTVPRLATRIMGVLEYLPQAYYLPR